MGDAQDTRHGTRLISRRELAMEIERELLEIAYSPLPPEAERRSVEQILGSPTGGVSVPLLGAAEEERDTWIAGK